MAESCLSPELKKQISGIVPASPPSRFALGHAPLDGVLGGGLARARLHEIWPADLPDQAAATGFALILALRAAGPGGMIAWIAQDQKKGGIGPLYPPGLAEMGLDPGRVLFVDVPDAKALLRASGDVVRSPAIACTVIAPSDKAQGFELTATRRLTLFAENSGGTALLLRTADPHAPSAAATRWRVAAAPSRLLDAEAPGHPAFAIDLIRQRAGPPSADWTLEWQRDDAHFAPLPRRVAADAGGGYLAAG
jgi:protein ImuA